MLTAVRLYLQHRLLSWAPAVCRVLSSAAVSSLAGRRRVRGGGQLDVEFRRSIELRAIVHPGGWHAARYLCTPKCSIGPCRMCCRTIVGSLRLELFGNRFKRTSCSRSITTRSSQNLPGEDAVAVERQQPLGAQLRLFSKPNMHRLRFPAAFRLATTTISPSRTTPRSPVTSESVRKNAAANAIKISDRRLLAPRYVLSRVPDKHELVAAGKCDDRVLLEGIKLALDQWSGPRRRGCLASGRNRGS